jgi:hypothetical protein
MHNSEQITNVISNLKKVFEGFKKMDTTKKLKQDISTTDTVYKDFVLMMPLNK